VPADVLLIVSAQAQSLTQPSGARSLAAARRGCPDAFAELVRPFAHALYRRALRFTGNPDDAEEIRQEALLRAFSRLNQFHGSHSGDGAEFRAWTGKIASNLSIDLLRQRHASRIFHIEEPRSDQETDWISRVESPCADPEEIYARKETRLRLAEAIQQLPPDLRRVCVLRDVFQYSTREVARRVGISNVAVRLRLFRAHALLRDCLHSRQVAKSAASRLSSNNLSRGALCPLPQYSGD
jgi:RNA polymerase sigma-70 factor (ECF subfamily)